MKSVVPQVQRSDIEEALIPLFEETNKADSVKFVDYEREIHKKFRKKLSLRKNVLHTKCLKLVREAFDRHRKGNAHVINEIFEKFVLSCAFH